MKKKTVLRISGVLCAAVLSLCFLYDCTIRIYKNMDTVSKAAAQKIFSMNYENISENNIYIEKDELKEKEEKEEQTEKTEKTENTETPPDDSAEYFESDAAQMTLSGGVERAGIWVKIGDNTQSVDFEAEMSAPLEIKTTADAVPTVLLYHTHTCECYDNGDGLVRSTDNGRNVVAVGNAIKKTLESYGIGVIHDTTVYDTTYNGSYYRSEEGVLKILEENPQIEITIDIHRDSLLTANGDRIRPITTVNGKRAAQIMIISGCDPDGSLNFPYWRDNLRFALQLQKNISDISPSLLRPLFYCNRVYNMYLTKASILVEFGTDANSPGEAIYAGELFGEALAKKIIENSR